MAAPLALVLASTALAVRSAHVVRAPAARMTVADTATSVDAGLSTLESWTREYYSSGALVDTHSCPMHCTTF